ncbi:hypothetical protein BU25DRAFT_426252 [Macroventuria anomochaeta]|uniref:Uncharacterized protein n=1 Tax=Macroventuria anomochaeta TaxID=301207 RepID=A0ACB6RIY1_9PLEO|nr:uncharacterized protein BU25DRAFT_426252 [Macroventuria anomochaeta]KAF2621647.1 hypothetical protein BU25DRAFT_426252 [Macroventuria anomochaeta]
MFDVVRSGACIVDVEMLEGPLATTDTKPPGSSSPGSGSNLEGVAAAVARGKSSAPSSAESVCRSAIGKLLRSKPRLVFPVFPVLPVFPRGRHDDSYARSSVQAAIDAPRSSTHNTRGVTCRCPNQTPASACQHMPHGEMQIPQTLFGQSEICFGPFAKNLGRTTFATAQRWHRPTHLSGNRWFAPCRAPAGTRYTVADSVGHIRLAFTAAQSPKRRPNLATGASQISGRLVPPGILSHRKTMAICRSNDQGLDEIWAGEDFQSRSRTVMFRSESSRAATSQPSTTKGSFALANEGVGTPLEPRMEPSAGSSARTPVFMELGWQM